MQPWMPPNQQKQIEAIDPLYSYPINCINNEKYPSNINKYKANEHIKWLDKTLKIAVFNPSNWTQFFFNKTAPKDNDWLNTTHGKRDQKGQTFMDWMNAYKNILTNKKFKIGLISIGNLNIHLSQTKTRKITNLQHILIEFVETFFMLPVKVIDSSKVNMDNIGSRINSNTKLSQLNTRDITQRLNMIKTWNSQDLFMLMGYTIYDLFPDESWNFVFGEASMRDGTGIFSFSRYLPGFYDKLCGKKMLFGKHKTLRNLLKVKKNDKNKKLKEIDITLPLNESEQIIFMRRCMKVLVHEIGHLFHFEHCIFFECIMNGSNHLVENDKQPFYLCPVCLNKFYFSRWDNFQIDDEKQEHVVKAVNILDRYKALKELMGKLGLEEQRNWYGKRIKCIENELKEERWVELIIVNGFIRTIQALFDEKLIVHESIYAICCKYYNV
eukprot:206330_1